MIGKSPAFLKAVQSAKRVAPLPICVLICGETGTGKEGFAGLIHENSRRGRSFVPVNCASLQGQLMDSLLFGHERGSFTGAVANSKGYWREAEGGTLFLDEIGELPYELQARLLRALETGRIQPVGSTREIPTNVRVVAATHQPIERWVEEGRFRRDLYARLAEYELFLPPLRERDEDILLITDHLIRTSKVCKTADIRLTPEARQAMLHLAWPENVRGIERWLNRLVVEGICEVRPEHLPRSRPVEPSEPTVAVLEPASSRPPDSGEVTVAEQVLRAVANLEKATRSEIENALGLPPRSLQRLLPRLVSEGRLLQTGETSGRTYRLPPTK